MADFSNYGGPSDELLEVLKTLPPAPELSIEELKRATNEGRDKASAEFMETLLPKPSIKDHTITARDGYKIQARSYRPKHIPEDKLLPIYIHYHGGGFLFGTLSSEDATCTQLALAADVVVLNVNYRHTPEWRYPTQWHDSEDAFEWTFANAEKEFAGDRQQIVVGGISAGAMLSAALAQTKKRENAPSFSALKGSVLMIPCLLHEDSYSWVEKQLRSPEISSYKENENAPILPLSRARMFNSLLYEKAPSAEDRKVNIALATAEEVEGLPPTTFGIAGLDPLRDEALLYAGFLAANGVPTNVHVFRGVPHGFRRFGDKLSASAHWDKIMFEGIKWALSRPSATGKLDIEVHP
ncbi:hypothetical protein AC578_6369 [Pseudocercospora eumusae]|uniref:Alpha/beta hydrolase fold-3 domain-containing protein n=1 Tax=Pseudocercospora eumusae TaxID=321146 RepID=A0A139H0S7_9PEZI|nr:hypothetical protein AC578_6369 [Pseudocercospora eumusae]